MQIHNLKQGSQEWHAYRAVHFNASDAPAMMGCSPYRSRNDLLQERSTGLAAEVDVGTQLRFDDGHRFEKLARSVAEGIVEGDLYPVTGSIDRYSASFDGITMDGETVWEHKTLNDEIRSAETAAHLGLHYRVQMEQQLLVAGAERCLFLATKWDSTDKLIEERHFWYESDPVLREEIIAGWAQFAADLAVFEPKDCPAKAAAEPIMQLPALAVQIRGEVTLSNLPVFKAKAEAFIASIKMDLLTDEDFANAEATIKFCDQAEKGIDQAKAAAIAQTSSIDELMRTVDLIREQLRAKRLLLTKVVADKKDLLKAGILNGAKVAFAEHVTALETEIAPIRLVYQTRDFAGVMKNKRTLASLHNAVDTELAAGKITVDALAKAVRGRLTWYNVVVEDHAFLFADLQTIIHKADEDFRLAVTSRIDTHKAKVATQAEAERARIQEEADAEAQRKVAAAAAPTVAAFDASTTGTSEASMAERPLGVLAPAAAWPFPAKRAPVAATTPPSLRLGQIGDRLGFSLTAAFLGTLGFEPAARDKAAYLYHEVDFPHICAALQRHISAVQAKQAA